MDALAEDAARVPEFIQDVPQHEEVWASMPVSDNDLSGATVEAAGMVEGDIYAQESNKLGHSSKWSSQKVEAETGFSKETAAKEELVAKLPVNFTRLHVGECGVMSVLRAEEQA